MKFIVAAGLAFASWVLVGLVRSVAPRFGLMDMPNARSSHIIPTPRGGGIAIVLVTLAGLAIGAFEGETKASFAAAWAIGGTLVAIVGFLDDVRKVSPISRLGVHLIAALIVVGATGGLPGLSSASPLAVRTFGWIIGAAAIVWSINAYNFMDGIDGLAASQTLFVTCGGLILPTVFGVPGPLQFPIAALGAASAGFLVWNFPPARIFMGDGGSGFIGFSIGAAAFLSVAAGSGNLWTWFILNSLFFADATTTLFIRLFRGERIYLAHRSHAYQRLARRWASHRTIALCYATVNLCWCLPCAAASVRWPGKAPVFAAIAFLPLCAAALIAGAGKPEEPSVAQ